MTQDIRDDRGGMGASADAETGSRPPGHAASGVDGGSRFDPAREAEAYKLIDDAAGKAAFMLPRLNEAQRELIIRLKPKRAWQRVSKRDFDRVWPGIETGEEWPDQFWFAGGHAHYPAGRKPLGKKRCSYGFCLNEAGLVLREMLLASADTRRMADTPQSESVRSTGGAARSEAKGDAKP